MTVATRRFLPLTLLALALPLLLAACSGGSSGRKFPDVVELKATDILPVLATSEVVVGPNRLVFGVLDEEGLPIVDAKVRVAFYDLNDGREVKKEDLDAVSRVPARDAGLTEQVQHVHADGTMHTHVNAGDEIGVYTVVASFDRPGLWGAELRVEAESPKLTKTLHLRFNVLAQGSTPAIGSPAPRSRNRTVADVTDLSLIDSSTTPSPEMHTTTVADAIAAGRPALVLFAVPGYCSSRLCGPELEIMRNLYPRYKGRAEFIHVEFYERPGDPNSPPVAAVREWSLRTEPWFFVIDTKGVVSAKFEGPTSLQELDEALGEVTSNK